MSTITKKINLIYQKVDSIAKKGKDGYLDYITYLEELLTQGEWLLFEDMMLKKYQIDIRQYKSVDQVKSKTYDKVRFQTLDTFQEELKELYSLEGVYQVGLNIYSSTASVTPGTASVPLGQIYEYEELKEKFPYYKDGELAVMEKVIILHLEVHKTGDGYNINIADDNMLLIDKYKEAI